MLQGLNNDGVGGKIMNKKCSFTEGITVKPNGVDELDPCVYQVAEEYANVTVRVLKCKHCGHMELEWQRQNDTVEVVELCATIGNDNGSRKVFAVPKDWLTELMTNKEVYDNTDVRTIYECAISEGKVLREEEFS